MATIETYLTARAAAVVVEVGRPAPTIECAITRARVAIETGLDLAPPAPTAPVNTVAPVVSGTPTEGETLSCTTGTWTGTEPITYEYQWTLDLISTSDPIPGATSPTYVLTAGDVGLEIFCVVTATNSAGSASANSNKVGPVASADTPPVNTVAPVASGTVRIGELLSTTDGTWTGTPAPTYAYQWTRDGVDIGGATSATYTVVAADINAQIACEVTATNTAGSAMEPSNNLASPWRPILLARPGVLIWDYLDNQCYAGASVGSPVSELRTVDGVVIGTQATSGARPTRGTAGLVFDGVDDVIGCDTHAPLLGGAFTAVLGVADLPGTSTTRYCLTASAAGTFSGLAPGFLGVMHSGSASATYSRAYAQDGSSSVSVSLGGVGTAGDYVVRCAGLGGALETDLLDASLTALASGTRPATPVTYAVCSIGARRRSPGTPQFYWQGRLRHMAIDDTQWSDVDTQLYRACALAAGVM